MPTQATLIEDSLYMRRVFEQKDGDNGAGFINLDMRDDKQYEFLVHRLLAAGKTPENSPRVFAGVDADA
jgi:hypothetical protein